MMLYPFLLLKSFKLETKFINIQRDTPTITGPIPVGQTFSNSLIIHQVKTKEITTVKEFWIPDLN